MRSTPVYPHGNGGSEPGAEADCLIYLVKQPNYELTVVVSLNSSAELRWDEVTVRMRLGTGGQDAEVILDAAAFETFYQDMGSLMAYLRSESAQACEVPGWYLPGEPT
jgi:hypothetical protein